MNFSLMNFSFRSALSFFFFSLLAIALLWLPSAALFGNHSAGAVDIATGLGDPRLAQLEFKVNALQSQVSRLQSQLSGGNFEASGSIERDFEQSAPVGGVLGNALPLEEQFDNLATLVVEINQRVMEIERRLAD